MPNIVETSRCIVSVSSIHWNDAGVLLQHLSFACSRGNIAAHTALVDGSIEMVCDQCSCHAPDLALTISTMYFQLCQNASHLSSILV